MRSTRAQALNQAIELSFHSVIIRQLLCETTFHTINNLCNNPDFWYNMDEALQARTQKAFISLEDSEINSLIKSYEICGDAFDFSMCYELDDKLRPYLLFVSILFPILLDTLTRMSPATKITHFLSSDLRASL